MTDAEPTASAAGARASSTAAPEIMVECIVLLGVVETGGLAKRDAFRGIVQEVDGWKEW